MDTLPDAAPPVRVQGVTLAHRLLVQPVAKLLRRILRRLFVWNPAPVAFWLVESPFVFGAMTALSKLGVFDRLEESGPQTAAELARAVNANEDALLRLLRAVSALGLLKRQSDGRFALNSVARQFCSSSPVPLSTWGKLMVHMAPLLPQLVDAVRTGQPLLKHATGKTCWEYLETIPGGTELHDRAMSAFSDLVVDKIAGAYDFSKARTLIDVGGGRGALLTAILKAAPHLRGTIFDRETTRDEALERIRQQSLEIRAGYVCGNFFEQVPAGADLYSIKHVLHDWDDEHAVQILKTVRAAIPPHGKLLVIEGMTDHDLMPGASVRAVWDLTQWMATWGKVRTQQEFQQLLQSAGFRLETVVLTPTFDALILEAVPV